MSVSISKVNVQVEACTVDSNVLLKEDGQKQHLNDLNEFGNYFE